MNTSDNDWNNRTYECFLVTFNSFYCLAMLDAMFDAASNFIKHFTKIINDPSCKERNSQHKFDKMIIPVSRRHSCSFHSIFCI